MCRMFVKSMLSAALTFLDEEGKPLIIGARKESNPENAC